MTGSKSAPARPRPRPRRVVRTSLLLLAFGLSLCGLVVTISTVQLQGLVLATETNCLTPLTPARTSTSSATSSATRSETSTPQDTPFLQCIHHVLQNLPVGRGRKRKYSGLDVLSVHAHHYDAGNKIWNADDRFLPLPLLENNNNNCSVWEVGAHTRALDTQTFLEKYPNCMYHPYEPIEKYFKELKLYWDNETQVIPHNYGVDIKNTDFQVPRQQVEKGQASYLGDNLGAEKVTAAREEEKTTIVFKEFWEAVKDAGDMVPTLVHMNCEGCEWDLLPNLYKAGILPALQVIQIGFHNYGSVSMGERAWQLCEIRQMLNQTHEMHFGVPFGWERWVRR